MIQAVRPSEKSYRTSQRSLQRTGSQGQDRTACTADCQSRQSISTAVYDLESTPAASHELAVDAPLAKHSAVQLVEARAAQVVHGQQNDAQSDLEPRNQACMAAYSVQDVSDAGKSVYVPLQAAYGGAPGPLGSDTSPTDPTKQQVMALLMKCPSVSERYPLSSMSAGWCERAGIASSTQQAGQHELTHGSHQPKEGAVLAGSPTTHASALGESVPAQQHEVPGGEVSSSGLLAYKPRDFNHDAASATVHGLDGTTAPGFAGLHATQGSCTGSEGRIESAELHKTHTALTAGNHGLSESLINSPSTVAIHTQSLLEGGAISVQQCFTGAPSPSHMPNQPFGFSRLESEVQEQGSNACSVIERGRGQPSSRIICPDQAAPAALTGDPSSALRADQHFITASDSPASALRKAVQPECERVFMPVDGPAEHRGAAAAAAAKEDAARASPGCTQAPLTGSSASGASERRSTLPRPPPSQLHPAAPSPRSNTHIQTNTNVNISMHPYPCTDLLAQLLPQPHHSTDTAIAMDSAPATAAATASPQQLLPFPRDDCILGHYALMHAAAALPTPMSSPIQGGLPSILTNTTMCHQGALSSMLSPSSLWAMTSTYMHWRASVLQPVLDSTAGGIGGQLQYSSGPGSGYLPPPLPLNLSSTSAAVQAATGADTPQGSAHAAAITGAGTDPWVIPNDPLLLSQQAITAQPQQGCTEVLHQDPSPLHVQPSPRGGWDACLMELLSTSSALTLRNSWTDGMNDPATDTRCAGDSVLAPGSAQAAAAYATHAGAAAASMHAGSEAQPQHDPSPPLPNLAPMSASGERSLPADKSHKQTASAETDTQRQQQQQSAPAASQTATPSVSPKRRILQAWIADAPAGPKENALTADPESMGAVNGSASPASGSAELHLSSSSRQPAQAQLAHPIIPIKQSTQAVLESQTAALAALTHGSVQAPATGSPFEHALGPASMAVSEASEPSDVHCGGAGFTNSQQPSGNRQATGRQQLPSNQLSVGPWEDFFAPHSMISTMMLHVAAPGHGARWIGAGSMDDTSEAGLTHGSWLMQAEAPMARVGPRSSSPGNGATPQLPQAGSSGDARRKRGRIPSTLLIPPESEMQSAGIAHRSGAQPAASPLNGTAASRYPSYSQVLNQTLSQGQSSEAEGVAGFSGYLDRMGTGCMAAPGAGSDDDAVQEWARGASTSRGLAMRGQGTEQSGRTSAQAAAKKPCPQSGMTASITLDRLKGVFHLSIAEAASALGIGTTKMKDLCRRLGVPRWPGRKLQSLEKLVQSLQAQAEFDPTAAEQLAAVMPRLEGFRATIYEHPEAEVETDIRRIRQSNFKREYQKRQQYGSLR